MSVLDYLSDFICCLYGVPGAYGVVTMPFSVREGDLTNSLFFLPYNVLNHRNKYISGRLRPDRKPPFPRRVPHLQSVRLCRRGGDQAHEPLRVSFNGQDHGLVQAERDAGPVFRLRDPGAARRERDGEDDVYSDASRKSRGG